MAHTSERLCYAADVLIVNDGAVLLRMHEKYNKWLAPGGHIEDGEDPTEAALREAKEEVGLDVTLVGHVEPPHAEKEREVLVPHFINRHWISDAREHISFIYFGTSTTRDIRQGETEVSENIRWFTHEELDDPAVGIDERMKFYAHAALDAVAAKK